MNRLFANLSKAAAGAKLLKMGTRVFGKKGMALLGAGGLGYMWWKHSQEKQTSPQQVPAR